jgi:copper homeostasis protein
MSMSSDVLVEVCADSVSSAVAAERGGATRIELCGSLNEGGITPSAGLIEMTRAAVSIAIRVMVRPRGGDFFYDEDEFRTMQRDIEVAKELRADGVVLGILDLEGMVDVDRTRRLVELAHPLGVTFHRAFDMAADLNRALEDVFAAGADRVLTSGGERNAVDGQAVIKKLVEQAGDRIAIMAGSGIKPENACTLIEQTGAREIHVGLRSVAQSPMRQRNPRITLGSGEGREYQRFVVLEENVAKLCRAIREANCSRQPS